MKQFYLLILSLFVFTLSFAGTITASKNNGEWSDPASWNPRRIPANADNIVIPYGININITLNTVTLDNAQLNINGRLSLNLGILNLNGNSEIKVAQNASIRGIISASININNVRKFDYVLFSGNPSTVTGPKIANSTTTGFQTFTENTLPVKFLSFNVAKVTNGVSVQWATAEEVNADVFEIERSEDGKTWRTAGTVKAVGNSTNVQNYSFIDRAILNKIAYYRIRQVDLDGKYTYTSVKTVVNQAGSANDVSILSVNKNVVINFSKEVKGPVVVRLISLSGQVLAQQTYDQPSQQIIFTRANVNTGIYIITVSNNLDLRASKQIAL